MLSLISQSGDVSYGIQKYYLDTPSDLLTLKETTRSSPGSIAIIISTGEKYMQNSLGQWILQST